MGDSVYFTDDELLELRTMVWAAEMVGQPVTKSLLKKLQLGVKEHEATHWTDEDNPEAEITSSVSLRLVNGGGWRF